MTRDQTRTLMAGAEPQMPAGVRDPAPAAPTAPAGGAAPLLPPAIRQFYLPASPGDVYRPRLVAAADIAFSSARHALDEQRRRVYTIAIDDGPVPVNWDHAELTALAVGDLEAEPAAGANFADCPAAASKAQHYPSWEKKFRQWLRQNQCIRLFKSDRFRMASSPDETEGEFRVRLRQAAAEARDQAVAKLRKRYATRATTLENRLLRARQAIEREAKQSSEKVLGTAVSFGTAILGALLGRKRLTASTASRVGSAIRSAGGVRKQASDVARARQTEQKVLEDIEQLKAELEDEVAALDTSFDAQAEDLAEIVVKPRATDVQVVLFGLLWVPDRGPPA